MGNRVGGEGEDAISAEYFVGNERGLLYRRCVLLQLREGIVCERRTESGVITR